MESDQHVESAVGYTQDAAIHTPPGNDDPSPFESSRPGTIAVPASSPDSPASPREIMGTGDANSRTVPSRRSRSGCNTCRKRKVKCDEGRPSCGHCTRLNLVCAFDTQPTYTPRRIRMPRGEPSPSQKRRLLTWTNHAEGRSSATGIIHGVNPSRAETVVYDASMSSGMTPGMNGDLPGADAWELGLLGEDSLRANIAEPFDYMSTYNLPPSPKPTTTSNTTKVANTAMNYVENENSLPQNPVQHATPSNDSVLSDEITLLRHFVDFAIPPILIGVEPRWNNSRNALLRLSKSYLPLRHAICAFSASSLPESPENMPFATAQSSTYYSNLAMSEVRKLLDEQPPSNAQFESHESILATIFFLSYTELIVSNTPKISLELLNRAHILMSGKESPGTALYQQLQIWLKMLDAKIVGADGEGVHLHPNQETRDPEAVRESYNSVANDEPNESSSVDDLVLETEEIVFNSINRKAHEFYVQVLKFSSRMTSLDKWHRSRGSVQDELEVMLAADKISRDLNALWTRRPAVIDLAEKSDQLQHHLSHGLATKVEQHLRTYAANFYASFIHLQRVAYAHLLATPQVKSAVTKIMHLTRLISEGGHALPVGMLWPLMMAACEAEDEEMQAWIIGNIEGMEGTIRNAARTAGLVREILKRQRSGQRADARTVMQETFGQVFAII